MIGNDIIDLNLCAYQEKSDDSRFLRKVFTQCEIQTIHSSNYPEIMLWRLWSMKEAAYKSHQRIFDLPRSLNPKSFECQLDSPGPSGKVKIENYTYKTTSIEQKDYIHTYTKSASRKWSIGMINFSKDYKSLLLTEIANTLQVHPSSLSIEKKESGIPNLIDKNSGEIFPISISHHGNFTGFIFPLILS